AGMGMEAADDPAFAPDLPDELQRAHVVEARIETHLAQEQQAFLTDRRFQSADSRVQIGGRQKVFVIFQTGESNLVVERRRQQRYDDIGCGACPIFDKASSKLVSATVSRQSRATQI